MWKIFVTVFALKKIQANVQKVADTGERSKNNIEGIGL